MHLQFIKEFVKVVYLFCDNNVIIVQKERRVKKLFKVFVKHISSSSFIVILKKVNFFPSRLMSLFENLINHYYYSFL